MCIVVCFYHAWFWGFYEADIMGRTLEDLLREKGARRGLVTRVRLHPGRSTQLAHRKIALIRSKNENRKKDVPVHTDGSYHATQDDGRRSCCTGGRLSPTVGLDRHTGARSPSTSLNPRTGSLGPDYRTAGHKGTGLVSSTRNNHPTDGRCQKIARRWCGFAPESH